MCKGAPLSADAVNDLLTRHFCQHYGGGGDIVVFFPKKVFECEIGFRSRS